MKTFNLNSKYELTGAQISFAESVAIIGDFKESVIYSLMDRIPVFLVDEKTQEKYGEGDILGFYQDSGTILGETIPIIGICLERILNYASDDEELMFLIASVIIHEFAHAKISAFSRGVYSPRDEFYKWMEESSANFITINYFENYESDFKSPHPKKQTKYAHKTYSQTPLAFLKQFVNQQPDEYKLGLDLFQHKIWFSHIWASHKADINNRPQEKKDWLQYVQSNVGKTDKVTLNKLYEALWK